MGKIEESLGWKPGVVNEVLSSGLEPRSVTLSILRGKAEIPEDGTEPTPPEPATQGLPEPLKTPQPTGTPSDVAPAPETASAAVPDEAPAPSHSTRLDESLAEFSDFEMLRELALRAAARELDSAL